MANPCHGVCTYGKAARKVVSLRSTPVEKSNTPRNFGVTGEALLGV